MNKTIDEGKTSWNIKTVKGGIIILKCSWLKGKWIKDTRHVTHFRSDSTECISLMSKIFLGRYGNTDSVLCESISTEE